MPHEEMADLRSVARHSECANGVTSPAMNRVTVHKKREKTGKNLA